MKILVTGLSMSYLSGQPLACYELCMEFKRQGHDVTMVSEWGGAIKGAEGYKLKENLERAGVVCLPFNTALQDNFYDICYASETSSEQVVGKIPKTPVINIVHSEYDCETPLNNRNQILFYVCIRRSIVEHITKEHGIPLGKCVVIPNGIDRERFKPKEKTARGYYKVVVPCTLDVLREAFLNKLIDSASEERRVFIYGFDCGAKLHPNPMAIIQPDKFDIQDEIADADEVAGILLGRVNLEAWSCGVNSSIYNPTTLEHNIFPPPIDFDEAYNIKNVTKRLLGLFENLEDLTIVIPHLDQRPKLTALLEDLNLIKKIIVSKNGTFAQSCNKGFMAVTTPYVCFLNDDTRIENVNVFRVMVSRLKRNEVDLVGCHTNQGCDGFYFENGILEDARQNNKPPQYPSGTCIMVKSKLFKDKGGFDEDYANGCDDIDLYLRLEEEGFRIGIVPETINHQEGSSLGRFDNVLKNIQTFNTKWQGRCRIRE